MTDILPLSTQEIEAMPTWATHYFKVEHDYTLFESVDLWQWFMHGKLIDEPEINPAINGFSIPIDRNKCQRQLSTQTKRGLK